MATMQEFANWLQACPEDEQALLDLQLDLNAALVEGMPPLVILTQIAQHFADNGLPDAPTVGLQTLLRCGADPLQQAAAHMTALHLAAAAGLLDQVRILMQHPQTLDARDSEGFTPLMFAVQEGKEDVVAALLTVTKQIDAGDYQDRTALHHAGRVGHARIAQQLLDAGAAAGVFCVGAATPLMMAATAGAVDTVQVLIRHGADCNALDLKEGYSALMLAAFGGHIPVMQSLIDAGADVNQCTEWNVNALTMAERGEHQEAVAMLKGLGATDAGPVTTPIHMGFGWVGDPMLVRQMPPA